MTPGEAASLQGGGGIGVQASDKGDAVEVVTCAFREPSSAISKHTAEAADEIMLRLCRVNLVMTSATRVNVVT
jgi:hypothetical protein